MSVFKEESFKDKVVLVTGSSSGIGESTVILYSKLGAKVVVTGRDSGKIGVVAEKCEQVSPYKYKPLQVVADMSSEDDVNKLIDEVIKHYGQLDILVNNHGIGIISDCESPDALEKFDLLMNVDLRSVFQLCWRTKPYLEKTKGAIVNNSSIASLNPIPRSISYCIAKAGLDMLTRTLAITWGPLGIRVNSVNPGHVDTPIFKNNLPDHIRESIFNAVDKRYPLRRRGYPDDIANLIVFLSSQGADWITGVNLRIDGGFLDSLDLTME